MLTWIRNLFRPKTVTLYLDDAGRFVWAPLPHGVRVETRRALISISPDKIIPPQGGTGAVKPK